MTALSSVETAGPAVERRLTTVLSDGPTHLFNFANRNWMTNLKKHKLSTTFRWLVVFEMAVRYFCISVRLELQGNVEMLVFRTIQNYTAAVATNERTREMSGLQKIQNDMAVIYCSTSLALTQRSEENHGRPLTYDTETRNLPRDCRKS